MTTKVTIFPSIRVETLTTGFAGPPGPQGPPVPIDHEHQIADVTGLRDALDAKLSGSAFAGLSAIHRLTQAEYEALDTPDAATLYVILG